MNKYEGLTRICGTRIAALGGTVRKSVSLEDTYISKHVEEILQSSDLQIRKKYKHETANRI